MRTKNSDIPTCNLPSNDNDYPVQFFSIINLGAFKEKCNDFQCDPHKHNYYSLFWVTQGSGDVFLDDQLFKCENNTLFVIKPGQVANPLKSWESDGWELSVSCQLSINGLERLSAQIFNILNSVSMIHIAEANGVRLINDAFHKLEMEANGRSGFAHNELKDFLLYELLICVCREIIKVNAAQELANSSCDSVFAQFQRLVAHHYGDTHAVSEYANMIGVSTRALSAATEEKMHCSPLKYLHSQLLTEAKRELLYTSNSVKEVAFKLGFADEPHFIKFFKRQTGETPLQFRKRHKAYADGK